jgi:hypothetical protein
MAGKLKLGKETPLVNQLPSALTVANPRDYAVGKDQPTTTPSPETKPARQPKSRSKAAKRKASVLPAVAQRPEPIAPQDGPVRKTVDVSFALFEPTARRVVLAGTFNDWSTEMTPMTAGSDGSWRATLALAPGRYEYKFLVDGQWLPDTHAQENLMNEFGTLNSIVEVRSSPAG